MLSRMMECLTSFIVVIHRRYRSTYQQNFASPGKVSRTACVRESRIPFSPLNQTRRSQMCTDVLIMSETKDQVVNARSQEFSEALGYRVIFRKKGVMVKLTLPTKPAGVANPSLEEAVGNPVTVDFGVSRYDYMGIIMTTVGDKLGVKAGTAISTSVFDGMNSAGLSAGSLNFQGATYQPPEKSGAG